MKLFKKLFLTLFVVIAITLGILAIFVATFDANDYKQEIINLVKKQTGRELSIDGNLKLAVYPDIALELGKISLANAAGFSGEYFAIVDSGRVSVKLLPLLKKKIEADAIHLNGLKLNLQRKVDGSTNWDDLSKSAKKGESKQEKSSSKTVQEMLNNLSIAGVNLKNANIHWRDDQSKQDITLSPLNLKTGKFSPGKPLPVEFDVVMKQKNPAMDIAADGNTTVTLNQDNQSFALSKLKLHTKVTGAQIPNGALDTNISGDIKGNSAKISVTGLSLQTNLTGDLIPQGAIKSSLNGNLDFDIKAQQLTISGMKLDSTVNGKPLAGGTLQALITGDTTFNLAKQKLSIPNLAVDTKLAGGYVKGGAASANIKGNTQFDLAKQLLYVNGMTMVANASGEVLKGGKGDTRITGDIQLDLARSQIKSPQLTVNTQLEGGLVPGGKLSQSAKGNIDLNWGNKQGTVNLSNLLVKLAGLEIKGSQVKLLPLAANPAITGQFQTNTFNLKQVLKTLGITPPVTSNPKALSQVQAQFTLKADTENADLQKLRIKMDKSQLTGSLAIKNFSTPSINPQLTIDSINLDDYLAPSTTKVATTAQSKDSGNQELLPLETLRKTNIDGNFKIGNMIINKLKLNNITAQVKAKQGLINIDPANASLYKGKYNGSITIDARQATPTMKMHHELIGLRSEGLLFDLFQDKYISGGTKMVTELTSRGNSINALLKNLNGNTSISFDNGTIRDSSFAEKVALAVQVFEKKELKDGKSVVKFTGLSGDWKTTNGVFKTDNLSLLSPYFKITGSGIADVASQKLDMTLRIGPNKQSGKRKLFAPLRIYGTFSDPKFKLNLKDLLKAVAQQDIDKVKLKAEKRLAQEKKALTKKLAVEKAKQEKKLKQKLQNTKADALKKLQNKTGNLLGDKLKDRLGGNASNKSNNADTPEEKPSTEDQVKDKLKNKLKGFF